MRFSEALHRANAIIEPKRQALEERFRTGFAPIVYRRGISESARDRALTDLSTNFIEERLALITGTLTKVIVDTKSMLSEQELREAFHELCPAFLDFRALIYECFRGLMVPVSASVSVDVERAFVRSVTVETEQIALLGFDVSVAGQFKGRRLVFISCGQYAPDEISLGNGIAALIQECTECEGYFAQNQQSFEGVTTHILAALGSCVGFVAIMHKRGEVETPSGAIQRASVWVEQEVAIVSYRVQVLGHEVALATYVEEGVALEGIRASLLMNPQRFTSSSEVLADFEQRLKRGFLEI